MKGRCGWANPNDPLYVAYHDEEWGVPEYESRALYEKLMLDGFQAGLAWITILRKRESLRAAFDNFEPEKIARYNERKIAKLLDDPGIIRSRAKIDAAIGGARTYLDMAERGEDFSDYLWGFVDGKPVQNRWATYRDAPAKTEISEKLSQDLKRRGFKFVGPVIVYAFMQAVGMVNDHQTSCSRHAACAKLARR